MQIQAIQTHLTKYTVQLSVDDETLCFTLTKYNKHCAILKQKLIKPWYEENILKDQTDNVYNTGKKLLKKKQKKKMKMIDFFV